MIDCIRVENLALIKDAFIEPTAGLTVLTGETGAGKTALLSSVKLLMGERADTTFIREGSSELTVEGSFFKDGDETVIRRRLSKEGRGRVEINGHLASVHELAEQVGADIDLCGQHEHQQLLSVSNHAEILDAWGMAQSFEESSDSGQQARIAGLKEAKERYHAAFIRAREAELELKHTEKLISASSERLDEARYVLSRIDAVDPKEGEYEKIKERLLVITHAEVLARAVAEARELLSADDGILDELSQCAGELERVTSHDLHIVKIYETLSSALSELEDVSADLADYADDLEFDPAEFDALQARMSAYQGLMRAFGPSMKAVFSRRDKARELTLAAKDSDELLRRARAHNNAAEAALRDAADSLDAARRASAPFLEQRTSEEMQLLEMGSASIVVMIERLERQRWTAQSPSRIEFLYCPAVGMSPRPLKKIASGGEISRVMLALKAVLGDAGTADTLIFDEVDAGVSGKTALAVARLLQSLAKKHQVIVVTHLAQVAVAADTHYLVKKTQGYKDTLFLPDVPQTLLEKISGDARVDEIARMLSGTVDKASRELARQMLAK